MTLGEHLPMAASRMFYIAIDYKNEPNMKVAASSVNIKIQQLFPKRDPCTVENLRGLDTNLLSNNVWNILVKIIIKLIVICLSILLFNSFMKMKNEK